MSGVDPTRRAIYAKLQIARKQLGLDEEIYREIMTRITGNESACDCALTQLEALLAHFRSIGFRARRPNNRAEIRKIYAIWTDMGPHLTSRGSKDALRHFIKRQMGVDAPELLSAGQAQRVIEALKSWQDRIGA